MVDIKKLKKELEELDEFEDKIKFLNKKFKEAKEKEDKKQILEIVEELIKPKGEQVVGISEDFSQPGQVLKPIISGGAPLEDIIAPAKSKKEEEEAVQYSPITSVYTKPSDIYTDNKKAYGPNTYEPDHKRPELKEAREEAEEERGGLQRESESRELSDTLKKDKEGRILN